METIYVELIEGTKVLVPVEAEKNGENIYKIVRNRYLDWDDHTSIWRFFPGDTVEVKKKDGNLIANTLVDSTLRNREAYTLLYNLVENPHRVDVTKVRKEKKVLRLLEKYSNNEIIQNWIKNKLD